MTTVFNGMPLLAAAMDSVLQQSIDTWEFVIVDDGSTDGTADYIRSIADPRVRLIEAGRIGRGKALNVGISECRADIIAILDADDLCAPYRLELQLNILEANPDIDLLCGIAVFDRDAVPAAMPSNPPVSTLPPRHLIGRNIIVHTTAAIRRRAFLRVGGYSETRQSLFDFDLWLRLALADCKIAFCKAPLAVKRIHDGQNFEAQRRLRYLYGGLKIRLRAVSSFADSMTDYFCPLAGFAYGLLPLRIRHRLAVQRLMSGKDL